MVCGGEERGICCGECICNPGWSGPACECRSTNDTCIAPADEENGRYCSGRGHCVCGECQCYRDDEHGYFGGPFCEDCSVSFYDLYSRFEMFISKPQLISYKIAIQKNFGGNQVIIFKKIKHLLLFIINY